MMKFRENEDAVSPVIGVILMVAITVILAAVIAAFVFGMSGNVQTTKTVAVTASQSGNDIILTYHGGADAGTLNYLKITLKDELNENTYYFAEKDKITFGTAANLDVGVNTTAQVPVGTSIKFTGKGSPERDHVVVVGHFMDGSDHVVLDTYV